MTTMADMVTVLSKFASLCPWLSDDYSGPNDCTDDTVVLVTDWEVPSEDRDEVTAGMIRCARRCVQEVCNKGG